MSYQKKHEYKTLLSALGRCQLKLSGRKATMGFDGFIDVITRVIKKKRADNAVTEYFNTIAEFGAYTLRESRKNFSVELEEVTTKIGGNMPITANALGRLGPNVACLGSFGLPNLHPLFQQMSSNCDLYSFYEPGTSQILEFSDGKIMLANIGNLNRIEWDYILETIGPEFLRQCFNESDMFALLNWSELDNSSAIWRGIIRDVLQHSPVRLTKPIGFFDLSDCSKRTPEALDELLCLLRDFSTYWRVVLSLNLNEAKILYSVLLNDSAEGKDVELMGQSIFRQLNFEKIIIHFSRKAICWTADGVATKESIFLSSPALSTGAGDNFNAGFCAGMLADLPPDLCLLLGHATACYYMQHGVSADMTQLTTFIEREVIGEAEAITPAI